MLLQILLLPDFILSWGVHLHSFEYHILYSRTAGAKSEGMGQLGKEALAGSFSDREHRRHGKFSAGP